MPDFVAGVEDLVEQVPFGGDEIGHDCAVWHGFNRPGARPV
jgi:hypothetical protein